jgi:hypothetical protein
VGPIGFFGETMDKVGLRRISNGYVVFGVDDWTYREELDDASNELELEKKALVERVKAGEKGPE